MRGSTWALLLLGCGSQPWVQPTLPCEGTAGSPETVSFDPTQMVCVEVEMAASDLDAMGAQQRFGTTEDDQWDGVVSHTLTSCTEPYPDPYTWFASDVMIDGVAMNDLGIRKKGFIGSVQEGSDVRPSVKLKTDRFVDQQTFGDTERITLNNNQGDGSRMKSCLAYAVFDDARYPAPRCNLANVMINGHSRGAYTHVEALKKRFLRRAFGDDGGSLYEATVADFTPAHLEDGLGRWEAKTSSTDTTGALLVGVSDALAVPDDALEEALGAVLDLDAFFTFWALETLVAANDGYSANTNNAYVYFDPSRGHRAVFIPWGPDSAFTSDALDNHTDGEISRRLSRHPALHQRYLDELQRLLDEVWDEDKSHERIAQFAAQVATAEDDPERQGAEVDLLTDWVEGRRAAIQTHIDSGGTEGVPTSNQCYALLGPEEIAGTGEGLAVLATTCGAAPVRPTVLLGLCALLLFRRRP